MKKELLAPVGDWETLKQAVHRGADAVYLGGKKFGARKFATNFDNEELSSAIRYCHLYGVKIYVTVNTMIYEEEMEAVLSYVTFLYEQGVDAIIVQDLGLIRILREVLPDLAIHASTQLHTHNEEQLRLLESLSVKCVVMAREMSLDEINALDTTMKIECFIHGALCVSYSGQCLFSSMLLSRSGNRGECAGICRLPFQLLEEKTPVPSPGDYLLSMRELNTMERIDSLMASKVTSFKIEGRMKSPVTIGFLVSLYRKLIDGYEKKEPYSLSKEEKNQLKGLFNREFTEGYLFSSSFSQVMNVKSPNHIGYPIGKVVSVSSNYVEILLEDSLNQEDGIRFFKSQSGMIVNFLYDSSMKLSSSAAPNSRVFVPKKGTVLVGDTVMKTLDHNFITSFSKYEEKKIPITMQAVASYPGKFILSVSDFENTVTEEGDFITLAKKTPTSKERVKEQLEKVGNTPFVVVSSTIQMEDSLFLPISSLNELRRKALTQLISLREKGRKPIVRKPFSLSSSYPRASSFVYSALVRTEEQLEGCLLAQIDQFYTPNFALYQKYKNKLPIYYRLDRVMKTHEKMEKERLLIGETGSLQYTKGNEVISDYYLNVANRSMVDFLFEHGVSKVTLSVECDPSQVSSLLQTYEEKPNVEVILYGWVEAMIMKYCPVSYLLHDGKGPCQICRQNKHYSLRDRNGAIYPLLQEKELTHLFFHRPLERNVHSYSSCGVRSFRFEFLNETKEEVEAIIKKLRKKL